MQFAVAFVDIALDPSDDRNADGVRVMEKIRRVGDKTSIVVVTGRGGADVIPITRDSIVKYGAHEIVRKPDMEPQKIRQLLKSGLAAFLQDSPADLRAASEVLTGSLAPLEWDAWMLRETSAKNGVQGLYNFFSKLLVDFFPLVPSSISEPIRLDDSTGLFYGSYWSRSLGRAIVICYANKERGEGIIKITQPGSVLLARYRVSDVLKKCSESRLIGAVFALESGQRYDFGRI
jgi:hypothetical protein